MPNLDEYRERFASFHTHLQRERLLAQTGQKSITELDFIWREHSELFQPAAIRDLLAAVAATATTRETETCARRRLLAFASEGRFTLATRDVEAALADLESRPLITWQNESFTRAASQRRLAELTDAQQRRELNARLADACERGNDLRAERLRLVHATAKSLAEIIEANAADAQQAGLRLADKSYVTVIQQLRKLDYTALKQQGELFLSQTERALRNALPQVLVRELSVSMASASLADLPHLETLPRLAPYFAPGRFAELYQALTNGLGFRAAQQINVAFAQSAPSLPPHWPVCLPLHVPSEIKLLTHPAGQSGFATTHHFLRATAITQLYAWTSNQLPLELRLPGDPALALAWGWLFADLLREPAFSLGQFGLPGSGGLTATLATLRLLQLRRAAATLTYEVELHAAQPLRSPANRYVELLSEALLLPAQAASHLDEVQQSFASGDELRAGAFAAQLRESLKTQFGSRWWDARKAGDLLIDLWNTGHRYSVEELAGMIGLGKLDFEWLGNELAVASSYNQQ